MLKKLSRHPLIAGSFLLTLAGFVSRLIGFFYRIYLSRTFGEEGMGIYQLITPIMALSFSLTAAGFQTAISRFVAEQTTINSSNTENSVKTSKPFIMGLTISVPVSFLVTFVILIFSENIAVQFLSEPRTAPLLRIMALSIPLSAVHACINGYFYGLKKAAVPAGAQIIEQMSRVASVFLLSFFYTMQGMQPPLSITVTGLLIGEFVSTFVAVLALLSVSACKNHISQHDAPVEKPHDTVTSTQVFTYKTLLFMVLPLIANRVTLNILQSMETVSLPAALRSFGYDTATSLSVYGVLTGMAFPLVFFPNAITGSIAVMLLPMISEKHAAGDINAVRELTRKTFLYCSLLGFSCMILFLLLGQTLGILLFRSDLAGYFITTLSFICPFLYLNNTLSAILQGIGKVMALFLINASSLMIRLFFIYLFVPRVGIQGYLWGLLVCQIFQSASYILVILKRKGLQQTF